MTNDDRELNQREHEAINRVVADDAAGIGPSQDPALAAEVRALAEEDPSFVERLQVSEVIGSDIGSLADDMGAELDEDDDEDDLI